MIVSYGSVRDEMVCDGSCMMCWVYGYGLGVMRCFGGGIVVFGVCNFRFVVA